MKKLAKKAECYVVSAAVLFQRRERPTAVLHVIAQANHGRGTISLVRLLRKLKIQNRSNNHHIENFVGPL